MNIDVKPSSVAASGAATSAFVRQLELIHQGSSVAPVEAHFSWSEANSCYMLNFTYTGAIVVKKRYRFVGNGPLSEQVLQLTFTGSNDYMTLQDWGLQRTLSETIESLLRLGMTSFDVVY